MRLTISDPHQTSRPGVSSSDLQLYTAVQMVVGGAESRGRRLSDVLNDPGVSVLTLRDAMLYDLLEQKGPSAQMDRAALRKTAVQLAVPSDPLDILRPRVPTQLIPIEIATSFFRLQGSLHRTASDPSNVDHFISGHNRRFIALSNATIRCLPNPQFDVTAATVLVNTEQVLCWWTGSASGATNTGINEPREPEYVGRD